MFWGLIMEPNKRYTQIVEKSFHVSMASLDITSADEQMVQVMMCYEDKNYLLCSLKKGSTWQVPLDLNFQEGTKIAFTCNGHGHVHLTGYLILDEDLDLDELEEEEEDEEEQELPAVTGKSEEKHKQPKKKAQAVSTVLRKPVEEYKQSKRKAPDPLKNEKTAKRPKEMGSATTESSEDDDDDLKFGALNNEDQDESIFNEEEEDDSEEEDEDDDEDEDDEDEDEEEEQEPKKTVQQQKEKKNKQAQQQQQSKKEDKKKLVNGKEAQQEQQQKQKKKGEQQQQNAQSEQKKRVVEGGVQIEDLKVGGGVPAKAGKFISVYYVGRLKNGKKFDSTTQGDGFKFRLGKGEVIKGWDVGIAGMKVGGKRRITIPPAMAYGAKGSPPVIPGNSTLTFEVELRNVH